MEKLAARSWPGNIRELENAIHRAMVLSEGDMMEEEDFPSSSAPPIRDADGVSPVYPDGRLKTMDAMEREMIALSLSRHGNNIAKAAEALGLPKSTFYRRLKEQNIMR